MDLEGRLRAFVRLGQLQIALRQCRSPGPDLHIPSLAQGPDDHLIEAGSSAVIVSISSEQDHRVLRAARTGHVQQREADLCDESIVQELLATAGGPTIEDEAIAVGLPDFPDGVRVFLPASGTGATDCALDAISMCINRDTDGIPTWA